MGKFVSGGFDNFLKSVNDLKELQVSVGIVNKDKHPRRDLNGKDLGTVNTAVIYRVQEEGARTTIGVTPVVIPPRPTLRPAAKDAKIKDRIKPLVKDMVVGNGVMPGLKRVGQVVELKVKSNIQAIKEPALSPITVNKRVNKGTTNPLVDTGLFKKQVAYKIHKRGEEL